MPITNNLKKQVDLPVWEWMRFSPQTFNNAASSFATVNNGTDRYIYYQLTSVFYRYDTWSDSWAQLASPAYYTPATVSSMAYSNSQGNRGKVLSGGTSSITIPSFVSGHQVIGKKIRITAGPGAEQTRTIAASTEPFTLESGAQTGGSTSTLIDTTKRWQINQWVGYTCRITSSTNATFQRTIIYNTVDTLYFVDVNHIPYEPWDNQGFTASFSTGTWSTYEIAAQTITFDTPLVTAATTDSRFMIQTGVLFLMSSTGGAPYFTFQMYDVLTDTWYQKTMNNQLFSTGLNTEISITAIDELEDAYISSTATSATTRRITDSTLSLANDQYRNYQIRLTGGTGAGQRRRITSNISDTFEVDSKWTIIPDNTTTYEIWPNTDYLYFTGNAQSATFAYDLEADLWVTAPNADTGITCNASATKDGNLPLAVNTALDNGTGSVLSVAVNAAGSNYAINDIIQVTGGGANCRLYVTGVTTAGAVTSVDFKNSGSGYSTSTGTATTTLSGSGSGCTINVTSTGRTGLVSTVINHFLKRGDTVTIAGSAVAGWNGTYTILSVDSSNQFTIASTATASSTATSSTSTSLIVDPTKNWDVNEHTGKFLLILQGGNITPTTQIRRITSNTATTITIPVYTAFTPVSGTTRYAIVDPSSFGRDNKFWSDNQTNYGYATGGSTTTIEDNTKNWIRGTWVNHVVRITAGTGYGNELTITANNDTTLTFAATTFTPDATTRYSIMDTYGTATSGSTTTLVDTGKNWVTNQWIGKRVRFVGGSSVTNEVVITSNTATTLNFGATSTVDATTNYVIYSKPADGAGMTLQWMFGNGNHKYLFNARGGATTQVNMFNITTGKYDFAIGISGQFETFSTGSMWAYDGEDRIYVQKDQTGRLYYFDMVKKEISNSGTIPYGMSTAYVGNRMALIKTEDGLKYLYVARHNGTEMWRTLLFW